MRGCTFNGRRVFDECVSRGTLEAACQRLDEFVAEGFHRALAHLMRGEIEYWFSPRRLINSRGGSA